MRAELSAAFRTWRRARSQAGFTVVEFALGMVLIMLPSGLVMFALPQFEGDRHFTSVVSREVARTVVFEGGSDDAESVVRQYATNFGITVNNVSVSSDVASLDGMPDPTGSGDIIVWIHSQTPGTIVRGESVQVEVKLKSPLVSIPGTTGFVSPVVSGQQTEIVDPYASFRKVCQDGPNAGRSVEESQTC